MPKSHMESNSISVPEEQQNLWLELNHLLDPADRDYAIVFHSEQHDDPEELISVRFSDVALITFCKKEMFAYKDLRAFAEQIKSRFHNLKCKNA